MPSPLTSNRTSATSNGRSSSKLRELPPFGLPDEPYPPPPALAPAPADDPRGVYLAPPEETAKVR